MDYCMTFDSHILQNSWGGVAYSDSLQVGTFLCFPAVCKACGDWDRTDSPLADLRGVLWRSGEEKAGYLESK